MECVFGLVGNGFAILVADTSAVHSILVHKSNEDKIMVLNSHKLIAASGEAGDRVQFTEYIQKNVALYQFRNGIPLTTAVAANFTRGELATPLRKGCWLCGHNICKSLQVILDSFVSMRWMGLSVDVFRKVVRLNVYCKVIL
ncbi:hypothetical protein QN277_007355 [Acacia crassicarpa]|uniref:Uncharacterized protein n=1 Tax=Acacia crassicarpa TaxID=499986 RepID=A0AAE1IWU9_9FABA|nr:hypothetical protein QN277_007355 [Acacia crassicarpa]